MKAKLVSRDSSPVDISSSYFFGLLMGSKTIVHIHHIQTVGDNAYAKHMALGSLYEDLVDVIDSIIETYQGAKKTIISYDKEALVCGLDMEPLAYLAKLKKMIVSNKYKFISEDHSHIHNELDNFITLVDKAIYKLTFL
jgi:hypothetical protein